ncbi:hypothetical protein JOB18_037551 [Solea senegalensis]|nr:hypothetical protein JOB18_037551 [Solea senegalensis]
MKNFVLASTDGIVLDFEVYQGSKALASQVPDIEGLGLGALVLRRLTETVHPGTKVYCDRFFATISAVECMLEKQVYLSGTVMKNRVPKAMQQLPSEKIMKQQGREQAEDICQRWSKKEKHYMTDRQPGIVREYNAKMGGVDLSDRMLSLLCHTKSLDRKQCKSTYCETDLHRCK